MNKTNFDQYYSRYLSASMIQMVEERFGKDRLAQVAQEDPTFSGMEKELAEVAAILALGVVGQLTPQEVLLIVKHACRRSAGIPRTLHEIGADIRKNWQKVSYAAEPYLEALERMNDISDNYGLEQGVFVVLYFLNNARGWRGPEAKRIKAELNQMVEAYNRGA